MSSKLLLTLRAPHSSSIANPLVIRYACNSTPNDDVMSFEVCTTYCYKKLIQKERNLVCSIAPIMSRLGS